MKKKYIVLLAFCVSTVTVIPASAAGITVSVMPAQSSVAVNQATQVALMISGLGNMAAPSLSAFDLNVNFNPALVSVSKTVFGTPSGNQLALSGLAPITQVNQSTPGDLHLIEVSLDSPSVLDGQQLGAFTLAEITVSGVAPGISLLTLSVNTLGDSQGNPLSASTVAGSSLTVTSSTVTPEPKTLVLLGIGLLSLLCGRAWTRSCRS